MTHVVMSTPIAIKNMDCTNCKAFEPTENLGHITSGTCHRHAPVIQADGSRVAQFPLVYLPEWCMEYITKD